MRKIIGVPPNYSSSSKYYTFFRNFIFYFRATSLLIFQQFSPKTTQLL